MDPEDEMESAEELRRRGAHVLTLEDVAIEGDPEAEKRREAVMRRARNPEAMPTRSALEEILADVATEIPIAAEDAARRVPGLGGRDFADYVESGTSTLTGGLQGLTSTMADEIGGSLSALAEDPVSELGRLGRLASGLPSTTPTDTDYTEARDRLRGVRDRDATTSPRAYTAGSLLGGLGAAAATPSSLGTTAVRALPLAGRLGVGAAEGLATGMAMGAGSSDAPIGSDRFLDDVGRDALAGAAFGGGGAAVGEALGAGARALGRAGESADRLRVASGVTGAGNPLSNAIMQDLGSRPGGFPDVAARMRRMGLTPRWYETVDDVAARAPAAHERTASRLDELMSRLGDEGGPVPVDRVADAIEGAAGNLERSGGPTRASAAGPLRDRAARMMEYLGADATRPDALGPRPLTPSGSVVRPIDRIIGELSDWRKDIPFSGRTRGSVAAGAERGGYGAARGAIDDWAEGALGPGTGADYRDARLDYGVADTVLDASRDAAERGARRSALGMSGDLAINAAMSNGANIPAAVATGLGRASIRAREPAIRATLAETARSAAPSASVAAGMVPGGSTAARLGVEATRAPGRDREAALRDLATRSRTMAAPSAPPEDEDREAALRRLVGMSRGRTPGTE